MINTGWIYWVIKEKLKSKFQNGIAQGTSPIHLGNIKQALPLSLKALSRLEEVHMYINVARCTSKTWQMNFEDLQFIQKMNRLSWFYHLLSEILLRYWFL